MYCFDGGQELLNHASVGVCLMDESRVGLTSLTGGLHQSLRFLAASHVAYLIFLIYTLGLLARLNTS